MAAFMAHHSCTSTARVFQQMSVQRQCPLQRSMSDSVSVRMQGLHLFIYSRVLYISLQMSSKTLTKMSDTYFPGRYLQIVAAFLNRNESCKVDTYDIGNEIGQCINGKLKARKT